jgi:hypothetical protein
LVSADPIGVGTGWIDQLTPSHRSANGTPAPVPPTPVHAVVDVHDTSWSTSAGLGMVWSDQVVPFHCSANVVPGAASGLLSPWDPPAVQAVADTHETSKNPPSPVWLALVGLGVL